MVLALGESPLRLPASRGGRSDHRGPWVTLLFTCRSEAEPARLPAKAIPGLRLLDGFQCLTCSAHLTRDCKSMQRHVSKAHQQKLALHEKSPLWRGCKLQTFFAENRWVRYFVVEEGEVAARGSSECSFIASLDSREADFFTQLDEDAAIAGEDAKAEANTVHGFGSHKSAVVPWLRRTGIEEHTRGLKKDEMHTSFAVPKNAESEPELFLMLEVMDEIFTEAHSCHFTTADDDQRTPESCIQLTDSQENAWEAASQSAVKQDRPALRNAISDLSMALVCHEFGGNRYNSPLLSFCAMLSVKPHTKTWKELGNYNSYLSGVIWVAQLIIFHTSAYLEKAELGDTLERIKQYCGKFLKQDTKTPIGEILGWRLLLFTVSKEVVGPHQAQWDVDEKVLTYRDVDLHIDHVPRLLLSDF
ncbi:uncharacterized protein LY89DRAFT_720881 [Mollisia scopiformis]|uniref:Uncharacterized protein n=1 Tax=Mollisia scopiformis TaxID=149040 RepID=A0A194X3K4_MOLSC|nr:uncharacterized protein LY89DRAFT_720881 [Mollisia scopiformis]KUJ14609.1 hypothetical protein LY89DRAFT_720881 [Mollisia scopiformis]